MSVSQSYVQESAPEYKYEGDEKDEERNRPVYHELGPKDNSNFHDSIKEKDWESFEKLLKKYKGQYYKRKRIQAKEIEKDCYESHLLVVLYSTIGRKNIFSTHSTKAFCVVDLSSRHAVTLQPQQVAAGYSYSVIVEDQRPSV